MKSGGLARLDGEEQRFWRFLSPISSLFGLMEGN